MRCQTLNAYQQCNYCSGTQITSSTTVSCYHDASCIETTVNKLPNAIGQQCQQWEEILRAEKEAMETNENGRPYHHFLCYNIYVKKFTKSNRIHLYLQMRQASESKKRLFKTYRVGMCVELLCPSEEPDSSAKHFAGIRWHGKVLQHYSNMDTIVVDVNADRQKVLKNVNQLMGTQFAIRRSEVGNNQLDRPAKFLLQRHTGGWHGMPGYATLLDSFGSGQQTQRNQKYNSLNEMELAKLYVKLESNTTFDESQREALCAALDTSRPIVAVHGPAASGKRFILAHYLRIQNKRGKRVLELLGNDECSCRE